MNNNQQSSMTFNNIFLAIIVSCCIAVIGIYIFNTHTEEQLNKEVNDIRLLNTRLEILYTHFKDGKDTTDIENNADLLKAMTKYLYKTSKKQPTLSGLFLNSISYEFEDKNMERVSIISKADENYFVYKIDNKDLCVYMNAQFTDHDYKSIEDIKKDKIFSSMDTNSNGIAEYDLLLNNNQIESLNDYTLECYERGTEYFYLIETQIGK